MDRLTQRAVKFARKAAQAGLDSAVTIAARTPGLVSAGFDPAGAGAREVGLLVREKAAAAYEGAWDAQLAWNSFLIKAAFGGVTSPNHFSHALVDVAEAAMGPARRKVRANAKRLTGMKPIG
jgi:hypothetical protein